MGQVEQASALGLELSGLPGELRRDLALASSAKQLCQGQGGVARVGRAPGEQGLPRRAQGDHRGGVVPPRGQVAAQGQTAEPRRGPVAQREEHRLRGLGAGLRGE
jgi:hypothetical protein